MSFSLVVILLLFLLVLNPRIHTPILVNSLGLAHARSCADVLEYQGVIKAEGSDVGAGKCVWASDFAIQIPGSSRDKLRDELRDERATDFEIKNISN